MIKYLIDQTENELERTILIILDAHPDVNFQKLEMFQDYSKEEIDTCLNSLKEKNLIIFNDNLCKWEINKKYKLPDVIEVDDHEIHQH